MVEDYGGIGRTTQTQAYTAWGKADDVIDAAGHEYVTSYDLDGNVQSVTRTDSGLNQTIASYAYGTTPNTVTYGQVLSVTDGLSGVQDSMAYQTTGGGIGQVFPLYDGHGNMIGTLARSGQGSYATGNVREYDAWGSVRSGQTAGDPKGRYCAGLGHKQDDESGYAYMRARYYDPSAGRFLSEDSSHDWINWFSYANNAPTVDADPNGKASVWSIMQFITGLLAMISGLLLLDINFDLEKIISNLEYQLSKYGKGLILIGEEDLTDFFAKQQAEKEAKLAQCKGMSGILKLYGYTLVLEGLLDDIELATDSSGLDILETMFGQH